MIAINGLFVEDTKGLKFDSFYHTIPIIKNYRSVVHFIKVDMGNKSRLNTVVKILS
jgi:hypothetical protein